MRPCLVDRLVCAALLELTIKVVGRRIVTPRFLKRGMESELLILGISWPSEL